MAEEKKTSFPMLPVAHWWALREKFKQSIPGVVTDNYLAIALNTKPASARVNITPYLKVIGLINDDGKIQDLAKVWRDDSRYKEVCEKIRQDIYPEELISAVHNPLEDRNAVQSWFANHTGGGQSLVNRMAAFYILLSEADVSKKPGKRASSHKDQKREKPIAKPTGKVQPQKKKPHLSQPTDTRGQLPLPGVNINLEIHISSDATTDQIDKIFESMAKHIYKK